MSDGLRGDSGEADVLEDPVVCFCNAIRLSAVVTAMDKGAHTLPQLMDATWAGCGPCGGVCQRDLRALLDDYRQVDDDSR